MINSKYESVRRMISPVFLEWTDDIINVMPEGALEDILGNKPAFEQNFLKVLSEHGLEVSTEYFRSYRQEESEIPYKSLLRAVNKVIVVDLNN